MRKLASAFILLFIVVIASACGGLKAKEVDLVDYVDVSFHGVSTGGTAEYTIDIQQAIADVHGWDIEDFDEEMDYLYVKKQDEADKINELYESYEITVEPSEGLANDDVVKVSVSVGDDYTYAFAESEKEVTVSGLEELDVLTEDEVKKHVVIDFIGANERGFARVNNTFNNEFSSVDFTVENDGQLKNGDKAKLIIGDDSTLFNLGYRLDDDFELTYEVDGLNNYPASTKDIKNIKDVNRLLEEEMNKNFPTKRNYDFETRYKVKEEATLYRQFNEDEYDQHSYIENNGSYIKLYTIEVYNDKEALDNKDAREIYVYARGYTNLYINADGNVNITELEDFSEKHDESYSLETVRQLYEGHGYEVVK